MKTFSLTLFLLPFLAVAQDLKEYKAVNNITYKVGDTVHIGVGTTPEGNFQYIKVGGINAVLGRGHSMPIRSTLAKKDLVIKRIKIDKSAGEARTYLVVNGGLTNLDIFVDAAIKVCEVTPCVTNTNSLADEIGKLKKLLDNGAITQAEYDAQKKKLLTP